MNSAITKNNKNVFDLVKFIMAIFVVGIHTHPLENVQSPIVQSIFDTAFSLAVPFFFLCSGYLLARKMQGDYNSGENRELIRKMLFRILKKYLIWMAIYFPLAVYGYAKSDYSPVQCAVYYLRGLLLVGEHYHSYPLWYLLSTVFACLFILILYKLKCSHKAVVGIGFAVIIIAFATAFLINYNGSLPRMLDLYCGVIRNTIINPRILFGMFYFPFGMSLARKELPLPLAIIMFAAGFIGRCIFIDNIFIAYVFLLMSAVGFFAIVLRVNLKPSKIYYPLRKASKSIYLIHMYVWTAVSIIAYQTDEKFGLIPFLLTSAISIIISFIYIFIKNKKLLSQKNETAVFVIVLFDRKNYFCLEQIAVN